MSADAEAPKKHRHDLGQEDHGPVMAAGTTRGIQIILGLWIVGTLLLTIYTLVTASRPDAPRPANAVPAATSGTAAH
jgi:beta-lactamase regulating signal transducer with metallopeptidase domain